MSFSAPDPHHQRAADQHRDQAAEMIRHAGSDGRLTVEEMEERLSRALAARTRPELQSLTADINEPVAPVPGRALTTEPTAPETSRTLTVMGETRRRGVWRPGARSKVTNVMGETEIDLTHAELVNPVTHIRTLNVMGSLKVRVPDGVRVHIEKRAIMGTVKADVPPGRIPPGAPVIYLSLTAIMAETEVEILRRGDDEPDGE